MNVERWTWAVGKLLTGVLGGLLLAYKIRGG